MNPLYITYKALGSGLFATLFPPFWLFTRLTGRYRQGLRERLGFVPPDRTRRMKGDPRIWIHAVSLGEVRVASAIINALSKRMPGAAVLLSTTTASGNNLARDLVGDRVPVVYAPLDTSFCVRNALYRVHPAVMVFLETEIWPAWLTEARRMGAKTAILNGRISIRSINGYLKLRPFFSPLLKQVDAFSMISSDDAGRIKALGADPARIHINGNAKYDQLAARVDPTLKKEMQALLNLDDTRRLFVAGSTRAGEEEMILEAYGEMIKKYPDLLLAIAPRHVERASEIETYLKRRGLQYQIRSQMKKDRAKRTSPIVIFNTFGELFQLYSVATIVFCGGSLVPLGGQNPLEPAVWGKVVLYGPHMEHFLDARSILEKAGAGITVTDASTMAAKALWFLERPDTMAARGSAAAEAVRGNEKSAEKHTAVLLRLLRH